MAILKKTPKTADKAAEPKTAKVKAVKAKKPEASAKPAEVREPATAAKMARFACKVSTTFAAARLASQ